MSSNFTLLWIYCTAMCNAVQCVAIITRFISCYAVAFIGIVCTRICTLYKYCTHAFCNRIRYSPVCNPTTMQLLGWRIRREASVLAAAARAAARWRRTNSVIGIAAFEQSAAHTGRSDARVCGWQCARWRTSPLRCRTARTRSPRLEVVPCLQVYSYEYNVMFLVSNIHRGTTRIGSPPTGGPGPWFPPIFGKFY